MRVQCVANTAGTLPSACLDASIGLTRDSTFPLTVGESYTVFAVTTFKGGCWYYIIDDDALRYPTWRIAPLFEVLDPSIPASWECHYVRNSTADPGFPLLSFPEWASDQHFYERLVEGDDPASRIFATRRLEIEGQ